MKGRSSECLVVIAAMLTVGGCGETAGGFDTSEWAGTVDTLESGRLIIRNVDQPLWRDGEGWVLRERLRLGSLDGTGPDVFGDVRDVELGAAGDVYVLDGQAAEVRVFLSDGTYVRTFGRPGEGPGEFKQPAGMALDSTGTLWVMDWGNARYTGFDPATGEVRREVRRLASFVAFPWPGIVTDRGQLVDIGLDSDGEPAILRLDTAFVPSDTLAWPQAAEEHRIDFRRGALMVMSTLEPFAPRPMWAAHPRGGIVLGEGAEYRLHRIDFDHDTSMTIELLREPISVTPAERDSALAAFDQITDFTGGATPERQPRVPRAKAAHGALFVDDEGRTWVSRTLARGDPPSWDLIAPNGRFLGQVQIPLPSGTLHSVRNGRVAVAAQVDGVPTVAVYDIVGAGS